MRRAGMRMGSSQRDIIAPSWSSAPRCAGAQIIPPPCGYSSSFTVGSGLQALRKRCWTGAASGWGSSRRCSPGRAGMVWGSPRLSVTALEAAFALAVGRIKTGHEV